MMKKHLFLFIAAALLSNASYANWFQDIIDAINKQSSITNNILGNSLSVQRDLLSAQQNINGLMQQVNDNMRGHSGWGTYQFQDHQSYGDGARDWNSVMVMAESGQGGGHLGQMIGSISNQFPADRVSFNRGVSDPNIQKYYALKVQTTLAARAASQLDYNKIQDQIAYQQMLQQQIEKTKDLKAAVDLNNRIQVEGNLINLEVLRQVALFNQQQSITEQASVNTALFNARFLTK